MQRRVLHGKFKLCKGQSVQFGKKGIPYLNSYDIQARIIKAKDTIKLDLENNNIIDSIKCDAGNVIREKHKGSFETIHIQEATGHEFATRLGHMFTIGTGTKLQVFLPKGKDIKLSIIEERPKRGLKLLLKLLLRIYEFSLA
ncbi:hypothetical protein Peur_071467 [Populus x canadensis]